MAVVTVMNTGAQTGVQVPDFSVQGVLNSPLVNKGQIRPWLELVSHTEAVSKRLWVLAFLISLSPVI